MRIEEREFKIDGIDMPRPSEYQTIRHIMYDDPKRLIGSGRLVSPYKQTVLETEWLYKKMTGEEYDLIYDAYILSCERNKSGEHVLTTYDSNTGKNITYKIITESSMVNGKKHLARILPDGTREYRNVLFTFVGVGGGE